VGKLQPIHGSRHVYPADMGAWEVRVLEAELQRPGTVGWYCNPARGSQDSLGIAYDDGSRSRLVRPDFIFFSKMADDSIVADIVDPHGTHLSDALPKLKGLAAYAKRMRLVFAGSKPWR
jgi:type III restriction enzyme